MSTTTFWDITIYVALGLSLFLNLSLMILWILERNEVKGWMELYFKMKAIAFPESCEPFVTTGELSTPTISSQPSE